MRTTFIHKNRKCIICLVLLGFCQTAASAVTPQTADMESLWEYFRNNEAARLPAVPFPYEHCFDAAARKYELPLTLLLAVARGESDFDPLARSDRNCHGLMQIQWPGTAKHLGIYRLAALYEPCTNIRAGARYLRELMDLFDENLHLALAAYNYGPNRIRRAGGAERIPRGAKWYSRYIYHHLQSVMRSAAVSKGRAESDARGAFDRQRRLPLITFSQPYRADACYRYLQKQAPALNLDWYRIGMGRYQVVMFYSDAQTLKRGRQKLRSLGVAVPGSLQP
jgi:hypothetical protein